MRPFGSSGPGPPDVEVYGPSYPSASTNEDYKRAKSCETQNSAEEEKRERAALRVLFTMHIGSTTQIRDGGLQGLVKAHLRCRSGLVVAIFLYFRECNM